MWFGSAVRAIAILMIVLAVNDSALAGKKIALCIGIDQYGGANQLSGCVNDAREWQGFFNGAGFENGAGSPVQTLLDGAANRNGIIGAIRTVVERAVSGDIVVIQYSGHGTFLPGGQDEAQDEAIVPVDLDVIVDDDIGLLIDRAVPGVGIYIFFDCCHSGTGTRVFAPPVARPRAFGDQTKARFMTATPAMIANARQRHLARTRSRSRGIFEANPRMREILFAACQPDENSIETNGHGVFTTAALRVLQNGFSGSNSTFIQNVVAAMGQSRPQTPQISCAPGNENLPFFSSGTATQQPGTTPIPPGQVSANTTFEEILATLNKISGIAVELPPKRSLIPPQNIDELIEYLNGIAADE